METLRSIKKVVKPKDWLCSLDLRDAYMYMHIPVQQCHQKFLWFEIKGNAF